MMKPISVWKQELAGGTHTARLASLYCCSPEQTAAHAARYAAVLDGLEATFGAHTEAGLYSAPGRTEIGGNHTDHQHGRVLAGSVNIDMIAAAAPNTLNQLRVQSEGYDLCVIGLDDLAARKEEDVVALEDVVRRDDLDDHAVVLDGDDVEAVPLADIGFLHTHQIGRAHV